MKITTFKTLDNGSAVILSRQPVVVYDQLDISFADAPSDATAIFECGETTLYRQLNGIECSVPVDRLNGVVKITVAILGGSARPRKWFCEELLMEKLRDGGTLVSPNDMNLPQRFIELKIENETIRQTNKVITDRLTALEDKLDRLIEGYDLT